MSIKELDYVVLKKDCYMKIVQATPDKVISMCKMKFTLNGILNQPYGSMFFIQNGALVKADICDAAQFLTDQDEESSGRDNRQLHDTQDNQLLSGNQIQDLRSQGFTGNEIVEQLVENSSTFTEKTDFAKEKYIKKKKQKHVAVFLELKPNARTLLELYYSRGPTRICNLRVDSLSQILTYGNVRSGSQLMVIESCNGLVIGSILERMGGSGVVVHLYSGSAPTRQAIHDGFRFSADVLNNCLYSFPLELVSSLCPPSFESDGHPTAICRKSDTPSRSSEEETTKCAIETAINGVHRLSDKSSNEMEVDNTTVDQATIEADISEKYDDTINTITSQEITDLPGESGVSTSIDQPSEVPSPSGDLSSSHSEKRKRRRKYGEEERRKRQAWRQQQIQEARTILENGGMDGLILASKFHPAPIVFRLLDFVKPSRPLVVFSPYKEPLIDCFMKLKQSGRVLLLSLHETWLRGYQILPERTHPCNTMNASGGYLLVATVVKK